MGHLPLSRSVIGRANPYHLLSSQYDAKRFPLVVAIESEGEYTVIFAAYFDTDDDTLANTIQRYIDSECRPGATYVAAYPLQQFPGTLHPHSELQI